MSTPHPAVPGIVKDDDGPDAVLPGRWRLQETRIPLESIGCALERGESLAEIAEFFHLTREQVTAAAQLARQEPDLWHDEDLR